MLFKWLRQAIDGGADGMHVDGAMPNVTVITGGWVVDDRGGSFDEHTMSAFTTYLRRNFSRDELKELGIDNISEFNYREWILENNRVDDWNALPLGGLAAEFYLFEFRFARNFMKKYARRGKSYAESKYDRDFFLSENEDRLFHTASHVDQFVFEKHYTIEPAKQTFDFAASQIKLARAVDDKPVILLPETAETDEFRVATRTKNLAKFLYADIYSSGGHIIMDEDGIWRINRRGRFVKDPIDKSTVNSYNSFIFDQHKFFENLGSVAKIAIVYSAASHKNQNIQHESSDEFKAHHFGYLGLSKILLEGNIQHDVLYFTDTRFSPEKLVARDLKQYDAILIDDAYSITNRQVRLLLNYVQRGGVLLVTADTGRWDQSARLAQRPAWQAVLNEGTTPVGDGFVVYSSEPVGRNYEQFGRAADRRFVLDTVNRYVEPQTLVTGASKVIVHAYQKARRKVLHLVNYDFDWRADKFAKTGRFKVAVEAPAGRYEAILRSPDLAGQQELTVRWEAGYAAIDVPSLQAYAVVELREVR